MTPPIHASCVVYHGKGVLITGKSGTGKSTLALQMIARGALLVADDRVFLEGANTTLLARAPNTISGLIEARNFAILKAPTQAICPVVARVDMDHREPDRLPPQRKVTQSGIEIDLFFGKDTPNLADALILYLRYGRHA